MRTGSTALLALVLALTPAVLVRAIGPGDPPELALLEAPVTDAAGDFGVGAIARSGDRLVVGGNFSYIGQNTGPLALVDPTDGSLAARLPYVRGTVSVVIPDGAGGFYIGGAFSQVGSVERRALARMTASGEVDPAFDARVDGSVTALARSGDRLFVGGSFDTLGGASRVNLGAVDPASGAALPGFDEAAPSVASGPPIAAFAVSDSRLYIAGSFYSVGGAPRRSVAALRLDTGRLDPGFDPVAATGGPRGESEPRPHDVDGVLFDIVLVRSRLYVGGQFTAVGGRSRSHLAALDPETGGLDDGFDPAPDARVTALILEGMRVYASGDFERLGGTAVPGAAAFDASTGRRDSSFAPEGPGELFTAGGRLYQVEENAGHRLSSSGAQEEGFVFATAGGTVRALQATGSGLLAGGDFASTGGQRQDNLAAFHADTGLPADWRVTTDGRVNGIEPAGRRLYVYGPFSRIGGCGAVGSPRSTDAPGECSPGFGRLVRAASSVDSPCAARASISRASSTAWDEFAGRTRCSPSTLEPDG